jgi:hypothetical protein
MNTWTNWIETSALQKEECHSMLLYCNGNQWLESRGLEVKGARSLAANRISARTRLKIARQSATAKWLNFHTHSFIVKQCPQ